MAPRTAKIVPPKYQNLVLGFEIGMLAYVSYELSRVYRGTHPHMSRKLAEHGIWPPPRLPAVKDDQGRGSEGAAGEKDDVRWMHINGLPVPVSFDALTGFWRR